MREKTIQSVFIFTFYWTVLHLPVLHQSWWFPHLCMNPGPHCCPIRLHKPLHKAMPRRNPGSDQHPHSGITPEKLGGRWLTVGLRYYRIPLSCCLISQLLLSRLSSRLSPYCTSPRNNWDEHLLAWMSSRLLPGRPSLRQMSISVHQAVFWWAVCGAALWGEEESSGMLSTLHWNSFFQVCLCCCWEAS